MTSRKDQEQYWANKDEPYSFVTSQEFAEAFQSFHIGRKLGDELATPFDKSKSHPSALTKEKYGCSKKELLKACISREYLLMKRNSFVYIFKMFQVSSIYNHFTRKKIPEIKASQFTFTSPFSAHVGGYNNHDTISTD